MANHIDAIGRETSFFVPQPADSVEGAHSVVPILEWLSDTIAVAVSDGRSHTRPTAVEIFLGPARQVRILKQDDVPVYLRMPESLVRPENGGRRRAWVETLARTYGYRWSTDTTLW